MQKLQPALREYLKKLREEAFIDIKPGYVDTGASPNQTQAGRDHRQRSHRQRTQKGKKKLGVF